MRYLLFFSGLLLSLSCTTEEETSSTAAADAEVSCGGIPLGRADVNQDGVVNILDLRSISCHLGEKVTGLRYSYQGQFAPRGERYGSSGTLAERTFFSVAVTPQGLSNSELTLEYDEVERELQDQPLRVEVYNAEGELVEHALARWSRGNIHVTEARDSFRGIDGLFFTDGAADKGISKLVYYMGDTRVDDVEVTVTAAPDDDLILSAEPGGSDDAGTSFTRYRFTLATPTSGWQEGEVDFITVDDEGRVLSQNTPTGRGENKDDNDNVFLVYFNADGTPCRDGQSVFARRSFEGNEHIYQGICTDSSSDQ